VKRVPLEPHYTSREAARFIGVASTSLRNMRLANKGPRWVVTADGTKTADQLLANVEIADEILQRMSVVLDQGGEA